MLLASEPFAQSISGYILPFLTAGLMGMVAYFFRGITNTQNKQSDALGEQSRALAILTDREELMRPHWVAFDNKLDALERSTSALRERLDAHDTTATSNLADLRDRIKDNRMRIDGLYRDGATPPVAKPNG